MYGVIIAGGFSLLAHATDINDLLEGLDGVLEDGLNRLHDTEAALHVVDLGLHALDGLHLAGDLDEGLSVIESLEDSGGEGMQPQINDMERRLGIMQSVEPVLENAIKTP